MEVGGDGHRRDGVDAGAARVAQRVVPERRAGAGDEEAEQLAGDFAAQMRLALKHIKATLEYAGSSVDKIAKVNVYLDRRADFDEMNEIYMEFFGRDQSAWPARTTVEARLPRKDFLLEIDCVAEV